MARTEATQDVAAIVAAYNEAATIGPVVETLVTSGVFREVIVIADGSTDRTGDIAAAAGASYVQQEPWKRGKGDAILKGIARTRAPIVFFCDADIVGFEKKHIHQILDPVRSGKLAMCVGIRDRGAFIMWLCRFLPLIGGERALQRRIFEDIRPAFVQGYMMEAAMNYYCQSRRLPYTTVPMIGVKLRKKISKVGWFRALKEYAGEAREVVRAMILVRWADKKNEFV